MRPPEPVENLGEPLYVIERKGPRFVGTCSTCGEFTVTTLSERGTEAKLKPHAEKCRKKSENPRPPTDPDVAWSDFYDLRPHKSVWKGRCLLCGKEKTHPSEETMRDNLQVHVIRVHSRTAHSPELPLPDPLDTTRPTRRTYPKAAPY